MKRPNPALMAILVISMAILWRIFDRSSWQEEFSVINHDVTWYYAYLPAAFIYEDLTLDFTDNYKGPHEFNIRSYRAPNGGKVIKMSMGLSVLYAPFFFMGHAAAHLLHYDTGGYSPPYKFFLTLGAFFYLIVGLYFLRRILQLYFKPWICAITLLTIVVATNFFRYATEEAAMSHTYNFTLIVLFLWFTIKWHQESTIRHTIVLGLLAGIISLVRPTNALVVLIFLLYNVSSLDGLKQQWLIFRSNTGKLMLMAFLAFLVWVPQLVYWKVQTGQWLFFSYVGERFYITEPHISEGLLGFRKGWLVYNPVMVFALAGIPLLFRRMKEFAWAVAVFFIVNVYVIFSWWCWWYGGSLGGRPLIDSYGLLAIPFALALQWTLERPLLLKYALSFIFLLSFAKGIHYNVQFHYGALHADSMTRAAYFDSFWRIRPSERFNSLLLTNPWGRRPRFIKGCDPSRLRCLRHKKTRASFEGRGSL